MSAGVHVLPNLPAEVIAARKVLADVREQSRTRYETGAPSLQVAALLSATTDEQLTRLWDRIRGAAEASGQRALTTGVALVAVGGSGRGELCPFSDADLLVLHTSSQRTIVEKLIRELVRDSWDAGIKLSHSVRTVTDAIGMALQEPQFATAVVEARLVAGDKRLLDSLNSRFRRRVIRFRGARFYNECLAARDDERKKYGETVRQLEPDVKRSSGGLRDIHLIRWLGFARFGTSDLDLLRKHGALSLEDHDTLQRAQEFITRIRVDLHFAAGKSQETLTRMEQMRLAQLYGYADSSSQRAVEQFMQTYFRHTSQVADITQRFAAYHKPVSLWQSCWQFLLTHRSNDLFVVRGNSIDALPHRRAEVLTSLEHLLHLYELAGQYSVPISATLVREMTTAVPKLPETVSAVAAARFMSILANAGGVGKTLRAMYSVGLLERVVPEMSRARCLLQFNQYHAFTVDEHSLLAVEIAEKLTHDDTAAGAAYRELKPRQRALLHLAVLLHDLGKGFEEDHCEVGRRLAAQVADRLMLTPHQKQLIVFLVHKHLAIPLTAFRRDLSDASLLMRFSREVSSPENLRMLFLLTVADIRAVGPTAWTSWKAELVSDLYDKAMMCLGGEHQHFRNEERLARITRALQNLVVQAPATGTVATVHAGAGIAASVGIGAESVEAGETSSEPVAVNSSSMNLPITGSQATASQVGLAAAEIERRLSLFPAHYLAACTAQQIYEDILSLRDVLAGGVMVSAMFEAAKGSIELRVVTRDANVDGLFSRIAGMLSALRLEVLSATVCTTLDGIAVDRFRVIDGDFESEVPETRLQEIAQRVADVVLGRIEPESLLNRSRRYEIRPRTDEFALESTQVTIDSDSSEKFTIIDIFAHDRPGLLYSIACCLRDLGLSVAIAKISTHIDQVLDVFYVTYRDGRKPSGEKPLAVIHETLISRLETLERSPLP